MKLGYVIIYVPDVAAAVTFYERAFGLERSFADPSGVYAEMETGDTALAFVAEAFAAENGISFRAHHPGEPPAGMEIALVATDIDAALVRAEAAGARVVQAVVAKPWGQKIAYVRDPAGVLIELCTPAG